MPSFCGLFSALVVVSSFLQAFLAGFRVPLVGFNVFAIKFLATGVEMGTLVERIGRGRGYFVELALCLLASGTNSGFSLHAQNAVKGGVPSVEITSALGRKLYSLPDDESVTTARKRLAADPKNVALVLALSQAEAGRRRHMCGVANCIQRLLHAA